MLGNSESLQRDIAKWSTAVDNEAEELLFDIVGGLADGLQTFYEASQSIREGSDEQQRILTEGHSQMVHLLSEEDHQSVEQNLKNCTLQECYIKILLLLCWMSRHRR